MLNSRHDLAVLAHAAKMESVTLCSPSRVSSLYYCYSTFWRSPTLCIYLMQFIIHLSLRPVRWNLLLCWRCSFLECKQPQQHREKYPSQSAVFSCLAPNEVLSGPNMFGKTTMIITVYVKNSKTDLDKLRWGKFFESICIVSMCSWTIISRLFITITDVLTVHVVVRCSFLILYLSPFTSKGMVCVSTDKALKLCWACFALTCLCSEWKGNKTKCTPLQGMTKGKGSFDFK